MAFYNGSFKSIMARSINGLNVLPMTLTEDAFNINNPRVSVSGKTNTLSTLVATGVLNNEGESYGGSVDVRYTRLDLGVLFKGVDLTWETTSVDTADFAAWMTSVYDIPMSSEDIVSETIPLSSNNSYIKITAATDSLWFVGSCRVYYSRGKPDISDLIDETWASGIYDDLPTVDANYKLTYNFDYTGAGSTIRLGVSTTTTAIALRVWGALMGSRPMQWDNLTQGVLYTGEANVVAAGGRAGFTNLLIVPRLNIWAHFNS